MIDRKRAEALAALVTRMLEGNGQTRLHVLRLATDAASCIDITHEGYDDRGEDPTIIGLIVELIETNDTRAT